jgi:hypothetical protein
MPGATPGSRHIGASGASFRRRRRGAKEVPVTSGTTSAVYRAAILFLPAKLAGIRIWDFFPVPAPCASRIH